MDVNSPLATLWAVVAAVVFLRAFFTFWGPLDRKLNPAASNSSHELDLAELQGAVLNVRFTSGMVLQNVVLADRCLPDMDDSYGLNQMLVLRGPDNRQYFARASEIEYFEQVPNAPPLEPAPETPDPDAPESWR